MRMWMVDPIFMCRRHLLGEHGELHSFIQSWRKHRKIDRRITGNAIEPNSYKKRHDELAAEMIRRGMRHCSEIEQPDFSYLPVWQKDFKVDRKKSLNLLLERCPECRKRYQNISI